MLTGYMVAVWYLVVVVLRCNGNRNRSTAMVQE